MTVRTNCAGVGALISARTTMRVTSQEQRLADEMREDQAIVELEEELKSLDEAIEELKVVD